MKTGWVDSIPDLDGGRIQVVRREVPRISGAVDLSKPPAAVIHTTEGSYQPAYRANTAPHFTVGKPGPGKRCQLHQHLPLGQMGNALRNAAGGVETNRWVRLQVEQCGFSSLTPWLPADKLQRLITASLMEWAEEQLGIPETRPFGDTLDPGTVWATTTNPRRRAGKFGDRPGWYNHLEVPENDHWDCGAEKLRVLLRMEPEPELVTRYGLVASWQGDTHREVRELITPRPLAKLGKVIANNAEVRQRIRRHKKRKHQVRIVRRAVPK